MYWRNQPQRLSAGISLEEKESRRTRGITIQSCSQMKRLRMKNSSRCQMSHGQAKPGGRMLRNLIGEGRDKLLPSYFLIWEEVKYECKSRNTKSFN